RPKVSSRPVESAMHNADQRRFACSTNREARVGGWGLGTRDWGLGVGDWGDWGLGIGRMEAWDVSSRSCRNHYPITISQSSNPQSPTPNPQPPITSGYSTPRARGS